MANHTIADEDICRMSSEEEWHTPSRLKDPREDRDSYTPFQRGHVTAATTNTAVEPTDASSEEEAALRRIIAQYGMVLPERNECTLDQVQVDVDKPSARRPKSVHLY